MSSTPQLPPELLLEILPLALEIHPKPTAILLTSSLFYRLSTQVLYTHLLFKSVLQLIRFLCVYGHSTSPIPFCPRTIKLDVVTDIASNIFFHIHTLLQRCCAVSGAELDVQGRLVLDSLYFRLNSHSRDMNIHMVYQALSLVNPHRFTWSGIDPPHHFSIAIVPQAFPYLFRALAGHTNLAHLTLSHLMIPLVEMPDIPSLKTLTLSQATCVLPQTIAKFVLSPGMSKLEHVILVDAYQESIWGLRVRRSDIEAAAGLIVRSTLSIMDEMHEAEVLAATTELVRKRVLCAGKTERIIGGDRIVGVLD